MEGVPRATHSPGSGGREASGGCRLSAGPAGRSNPANRAARRLWDPLADEAARDGVFKIYSIPVSWFARVANIPAKQQVDACDTVNLEDARTRVFTILQRVDGVHGFLTRR